MVGPEEDRMSSGRDLDLGRPDGPAGAGLDVIHGWKMAYFFCNHIVFSCIKKYMSLCSKLICFIP